MPRVIIEPLGRQHDRAAFDSGHPRVNNFIRMTAKKHAAQDLAVVRVAVVAGTTTVAGYHSLSAHSLSGDGLPAEIAPGGRPFPGIGAFYLGFLGVHKDLQGRGIGRLLQRDAMRQTVAASAFGGIAFLVLDAIDEQRADFFRRLGFRSLPSQPLRLVIPTEVMRAAIAVAAKLP
jgi:ribosomal protein S18 acetylase RimI-like enzyme